MTEQCKACRFYRTDDYYPNATQGRCLRNAPIRGQKQPETNEGDWCGEFQPIGPTAAPVTRPAETENTIGPAATMNVQGVGPVVLTPDNVETFEAVHEIDQAKPGVVWVQVEGPTLAGLIYHCDQAARPWTRWRPDADEMAAAVIEQLTTELLTIRNDLADLAGEVDWQDACDKLTGGGHAMTSEPDTPPDARS
jgi:hypothetical protein